MSAKKWIWLTILVVFITALILTVIGIHNWFNSGNVRAMGGRLRVDLSGNAYVFEHETRELIDNITVSLEGVSQKGDSDLFEGWAKVSGYANEADGTMDTTLAAVEDNDGYWIVHVLQSCTHLEETENGGTQEVNHSCKYSYEFYVHPDKQDFMVVRITDKYDMYPLYVVMADSEEEAWQIYNEFAPGQY